MVIKPIRLIAAFILLDVVYPGAVAALDMEYYTYGGFTPVELAWEKISLIFSDANYVSLFFVTMTMGIFSAPSAPSSIFSGRPRGACLVGRGP